MQDEEMKQMRRNNEFQNILMQNIQMPKEKGNRGAFSEMVSVLPQERHVVVPARREHGRVFSMHN